MGEIRSGDRRETRAVLEANYKWLWKDGMGPAGRFAKPHYTRGNLDPKRKKSWSWIRLHAGGGIKNTTRMKRLGGMRAIEALRGEHFALLKLDPSPNARQLESWLGENVVRVLPIRLQLAAGWITLDDVCAREGLDIFRTLDLPRK